MKEIVIVAPSKAFSLSSQKVIAESEIKDVEVVEAFLEGAVYSAKKAENNGVRVLLSLPFTASLIKKEIGIPVIEIDNTPFDLLEAFFKAREISSDIAYISYKGTILEEYYNSISEIIGDKYKIIPFYFEEPHEIDLRIKDALDQNIKAGIVTGACVHYLAENAGMKTFIAKISDDSIRSGIKKAQHLISMIDMDKQKNILLQNIINSSNDGIIYVDNYENIKIISSSSEKVLGDSVNRLLGLNLKEIDKDEYAQLLKKEIVPEGKVFSLGNKKLIVKKTELKVNNDYNGYIIALQDVTEIQNLEQIIRQKLSDKGLVAKYKFSDIIHHSSSINQTIYQAKQMAESDLNVLITGETGVGKELFAHSIHNASPRKKGPFVAINCSTLPENLLESELFGYEKGAFTGANKEGKHGLFELAHGGTIFLDEIGDFPIALQPRLLRVLQNKEIRRVGGERIIPVDVRVIAATNADLKDFIKEQKFRQDLYYRLTALKINIPPLRFRKEDIRELINYFITSKSTKKDILLSEEIISIMTEYEWPGNVRELENFVDRIMIYPKDVINISFIKSQLYDENNEKDFMPAVNENQVIVTLGNLEEMEKEIITNLLVEKNYKQNEVASMLGISRTTLWRKIKEQ